MEWALWKQSAEDGNAEAQYQLGRCYANGLGVEIDMVEAVRWFTPAAEQGMAMAQYALGNCYYYGYGVDNDCMKAVEWYVKAADRGLGKALCALGRTQCFDENLDKRYYNRSWFWFRGAADQGDAEGQANHETTHAHIPANRSKYMLGFCPKNTYLHRPLRQTAL